MYSSFNSFVLILSKNNTSAKNLLEEIATSGWRGSVNDDIIVLSPINQGNCGFH